MKVSKFSWGKTEVTSLSGETFSFSDCKIWSCGDSGGVNVWDWNSTNTHHVPGVQISDAEDLVKRNIDILILSRGMDLVLQVPTKTIDYFRSKGLDVLVLQSQSAVDKFNELTQQGKHVGLVLHSTC